MPRRRRPIPALVATTIETRTGIHPHLANGRTHTTRCPHCHTLVLTGITPHPCGANYTIDPTALTPQGLTAAIILNTPTWTLHPTPTGWTAEDHTWPGIPGTWANPGPHDITAPAHQCGRTLPGTPLPPRPRTTPGYDLPQPIPYLKDQEPPRW